MHIFPPPRGLAEALKAALLRFLVRTLLKPVFSPRRSIADQRRSLLALTRYTPVPASVSIEPGVVGGVPGEWLRCRHAPPAARTATGAVERGALVYLHGGAYCVGAPASQRAITIHLARLTGLPVFAPDYRLAPEHPHPAALDDALAVCRALLAEAPVVLAGDSAGGGLALATAVALRDAARRAPSGEDQGEGAASSVDAPTTAFAQPAALLLFSPWVDLTLRDAPDREPANDPMLTVAWARACADHYRGAAPASDPLISPLYADLRGLPPTLVQAGTDEMLHDEALRLHAALQAARVDARCEITPGRWHVFQAHAGVLRSADAALERAARFVLGPLTAARGPHASTHEVVILGAGMSGLCMAIGLQRAGIHDFVILEQQPGLGGTWWDNVYPGAHVDVPSPVYSYSFAPNPGWSRRFAGAPEIQAYMQDVAARHGLLAHLRLGTRLAEATFDEADGHWAFKTARGDTLRSRFFACSTGPLSQPRWPDIPGLDAFEGTRLHSARWDRTWSAAGQRVAVIGTGSTASQLVAPIAAQAQRLHVFQRTANWVMPRRDRPYHALDRVLASFPPYARLVRWSWTQVLEWGRRGFDEGTLMRRLLLKEAAAHRAKQVPDAALRARLEPPYPLGCKRIIYSNDYYPALTQPNVELVTDAIERVTAHGVVTADGRERTIDALVCATGFDLEHLLSSVQVTGLRGRTLAETWADGAEAYHGISVAGFPNLFMMLGPNTATGHTSTLLYIEPEVEHAIACMQSVRGGGHRWIEVRPEVMRAHNDALQARLGGSVWSRCRSWYRLDNGRIVALFPGFTREYVEAVRRPPGDAYRFG